MKIQSNNKIRRLLYRLTGYSKEQTDFLVENNITDDEINIIQYAFNRGIKAEQAKIFLNGRAWNKQSVRKMVLAFLSGLSYEEVAFCFPSWSTPEQSQEAVKGFEAGLSPKKIQFYFQKGYSSYDMSMLRNALIHNIPIEDLSTLICSANNLDTAQMYEGIKGLEAGLDIEHVLFYCRSGYSAEQMEQARFGLLNGLNTRQLSVFYISEISSERMEKIRIQIEDELNCQYVRKGMNYVKGDV